MPRYRFSPQGFTVSEGKHTHPVLGEVEIGEVYDVPDRLVPQFDASADWEPENASKKGAK